ncbi:U-box domain protein [Diplonema papillatum]|nr:U-box domain protein [Diplonema papillatum]
MEQLVKISAEKDLGSSQLSKVAQLSLDVVAVRTFYEQHHAAFKVLCESLLATLNSDSSLKNKTAALASLSSFSRYKVARDDLYNILKKIDSSFEATLQEKVQGSEAFGTGLGKLHSTMLVFMMRVFGYRIRGEEVLEYANGKTAFALDLFSEVFKVPSYEVEILADCCAAILDLCSPVVGKDGQADKAFAARVDQLIEAFLHKNIMAHASVAIRRKLRSSQDKSVRSVMPNALHLSIVSIIRATLNLYHFSSQGTQATALRQSLLVATDFICPVLPTYVKMCCEEIQRCVDDHDAKKYIDFVSPLLATGITWALKCMAFASFHLVGKHTVQLRVSNVITCTLLSLPIKEFVVQHHELYACLLHFNVNLDSLAGEHILPAGLELEDVCKSSVLLRVISQLLSALSCEESEALWKSMAAAGHHLPLARDTTSYDLLSHLFEASIKGESKLPNTPPDAINALDAQFLDNIAEALDRRMELLEAERPDDHFASMRKDLQHEKAKQATSPQPHLKHLADLPSLPALMPSAPCSPSRSVPAPMTEPIQADEHSAAPVKPAAPARAQELWKSAVDDAGDVPEEFRCAINGHVLNHPMRLPSGRVFERETIELWIKKVGWTDPITAAVIRPDDLVPDEKLRLKILEWRIQQTAAANANEDEDSMYQF